MDMQDLKSKIFRKRFLIPLAGVLAGMVGGYLYYHFVGCRNGTCAITSNPWLSMLWGAAVGYLLGDMFVSRRKRSAENAR